MKERTHDKEKHDAGGRAEIGEVRMTEGRDTSDDLLLFALRCCALQRRRRHARPPHFRL